MADTRAGKPTDKFIIYGERPITEFFLTMITDEEINHLFKEIELSTDDKIPLDGQNRLSQIFIEAPLGRQFGVVDILFAYDDFSVLCEIKPYPYDTVSKRLDKQIRSYVISMSKPVSNRQTDLVRLVHKTISGKKTYLIAITDDTKFPPKLRDFYKGLEHSHVVDLGWASYIHLRSVLKREGFDISTESRNLWARRQPEKKESGSEKGLLDEKQMEIRSDFEKTNGRRNDHANVQRRV